MLPEKPIIAAFADGDLLAEISARLEERYQLQPYNHTLQGDRLIARLADDQAALLLIQAGDHDWTAAISTAKTSPATRRISVIAVTANDQEANDALIAGANQAVTREQLLTELETLIAEQARVLSAEHRQQIESACADELPETARRAIELFNAGEYYQQHDLLEALWMETEGPIRDLYRAILQVGIAYYQITRGNERGALKMVLRSLQWLAVLPDKCQGVDIGQLREDVAEVRRRLEFGLYQNQIPPDEGMLKPVKLYPR